MDIGFVGLGNMGLQMARRLVEAGHRVVAHDQRAATVDALVALGAEAAASPKAVADLVPTVLASLPSPQASIDVATGVSQGARVERFVDFSTVGAPTGARVHGLLAAEGIAAIDCPVSGGVGGARNGTLAMMVSGDAAQVDEIRPALDVLGTVYYVGATPGSAQTMKLANNLLAATTLAATAEAVVFGVKAGLDPAVMIDVFNAGSGATHASRDKFPRAVLPRTFDFGFATGLMVKDVRLCLEHLEALGLSMPIAEAVGRQWELTLDEMGAESDFTTVIQPIERAAGIDPAATP